MLNQRNNGNSAAPDERSTPTETELLSAVLRTQQEVATAALDLNAVMNLIAERAQRLTRAAGAAVELLEGDEMVYRAATGAIAPALGLRLKSADSLSGLCVRTGTPLRCDDTEADDRVNKEACRKVGIRSMIVVPLRHDRRTVGVLKVSSPRVWGFNEKDQHTLQLMGGLLAAAMSNAAAFETEQALVGERTKALRDSEAVFRSAFEDTNMAMVLMDIGHRFVRVNAAFARLFGYTPKELLRLSLSDVTHPDDLAESLAGRDRLTAGEASHFQMEKRYRCKDGRVIWGLANVSLVRDAAGGPLLYVGQVQDITERKRAVAELKAAVDLLRAVADGTTDAVFVKDRAGRYLLFNPAAARFVGRSAEEVIGRDDTALFEPESARWLMNRDRRVMASGRVETEEETLTAAGVTRTYQATKGPYLDEAGNVIGVIGISRDVTEERRLTAERTDLLRRQAAEVEAQRLHVLKATMRTVHDIVNNFLNGLQLVTLAAGDALPPAAAELLDTLTQDTAAKLKALGDLESVPEKQMAAGVGIDYGQ